MERTYYSTYKFYDERGRRLSIFATVMNEAQISVTIVTCAKGDKFSRKVGKALYEQWLEGTLRKSSDCHPQIRLIAIKDGKPKKTFLSWCRETYYTTETGYFGVTLPILTRGPHDILISKQLIKNIVKNIKSV